MTYVPRKKQDNRAALPLVAPFVIIYAALFLYPTLQMLAMSLTDGQLILPGEWVGLDNYLKLFRDWRFGNSVANTAYFVALTVVPGTLLELGFAMLVARLKGFWQAVVLAVFFLPYILPVTTVTSIWTWFVYGPGQAALPDRVLGRPPFVLPIAAVITVWWTVGFNVLLFMAGLKNIPAELHETAKVDGAGHWRVLWSIYLPVNWGVTAALAIIVFIGAWKAFLWPFLVVTKEPLMNVTVAIGQVEQYLGVGGLAAALLAGLPVAVVYLVFQKKVTEAIMLSSRIKG